MKYAGTVCGIVVFVLCFALMAYADETVAGQTTVQQVEQIKIFAQGIKENYAGLEARVNSWLMDNKEKINVIRGTQSSSGNGFLVITVFYKLKQAN